MFASRPRIHKTFVKIANREDLDLPKVYNGPSLLNSIKLLLVNSIGFKGVYLLLIKLNLRLQMSPVF